MVRVAQVGWTILPRIIGVPGEGCVWSSALEASFGNLFQTYRFSSPQWWPLCCDIQFTFLKLMILTQGQSPAKSFNLKDYTFQRLPQWLMFLALGSVLGCTEDMSGALRGMCGHLWPQASGVSMPLLFSVPGLQQCLVWVSAGLESSASGFFNSILFSLEFPILVISKVNDT